MTTATTTAAEVAAEVAEVTTRTRSLYLPVLWLVHRAIDLSAGERCHQWYRTHKHTYM
jgi:hypothetical protein